jgi:hypothetical protein
LGNLIVRSFGCSSWAGRRFLTSPRGSISLQAASRLLSFLCVCGSEGPLRPCGRRDKGPDAVADIVIFHPEGSGIGESKVDAVDVFLLGRAIGGEVQTDVDEDLLDPVLGLLWLLRCALLRLTKYLGWASSINYP